MAASGRRGRPLPGAVNCLCTQQTTLFACLHGATWQQSPNRRRRRRHMLRCAHLARSGCQAVQRAHSLAGEDSSTCRDKRREGYLRQDEVETLLVAGLLGHIIRQHAGKEAERSDRCRKAGGRNQ